MDRVISTADADRICRLVEECCELWDDPPAWQRHAAVSLERLVGGFCGVLLRQLASPPASRQNPRCDWSTVTWRAEECEFGDAVDGPTRAVLGQFVANGGPRLIPGIPKVRRPLLHDGSFCARYEELTSARVYRQSEFFESYMEPIHAHEALGAFAFCSDSSYTMFVIHRERADRPFSDRDSSTLETLACALASRTGVRLSTRRHRGRHHLTTRQKQVLEHLLAGDSEKQIADELGISATTVHEYVKALHHYYGVHSRGELMAHHLRRIVSVTTSFRGLVPRQELDYPIF